MSLREQSISAGARSDARELRNAFARFATGVAVVTTRAADGQLKGVTANSFSAVSLDPPLVLWSLRRNAPSLQSFAGSTHFAVNVLAADQIGVSHRFAQPHHDKFRGITCAIGLGGCPLIDGALAVFECAVEQQIEGGDHVIFLGKLCRAAYRDGDPLLFNAGRYCTVSPVGPDELSCSPQPDLETR